MRLLILSAVLAVAACNFQPEIRLGSGQGIPSVSGATEVSLETLVCGDPIPAGPYTVTTKKVSGGCELSFDKDVEVLTAADYQRIPELGSATTLLQTVELKITKLAFTDATTDIALNPMSQIASATLLVNGQVVGDKTLLSALPRTVSLTGAALQAFKSKVDQRVPASVRATSLIVLPESPPPPKKLRIEYDAQPTLVLGAGELKL